MPHGIKAFTNLITLCQIHAQIGTRTCTHSVYCIYVYNDLYNYVCVYCSKHMHACKCKTYKYMQAVMCAHSVHVCHACDLHMHMHTRICICTCINFAFVISRFGYMCTGAIDSGVSQLKATRLVYLLAEETLSSSSPQSQSPISAIAHIWYASMRLQD